MAEYHKDMDVVATLNPEEYRVTQESGTERPGTGKYLGNKEPGIYVDIVSGEPLLPLPTNTRVGAAGPLLPSRWCMSSSTRCATQRMG